MIYCTHKYGGKKENKASVEAKIRKLQMNDPDNTYVSPIHAFGFMYRDTSYDRGVEMCLSLLARCDALLILSEESEGVSREITYAMLNGIPIYTERGIENAR